MEIKISLEQNKIQSCQYGDFEIFSDATIENGGEGKFPEPFDYLLASIGLCSGHYAREFCLAREIKTTGLRLRVSSSKTDDKEHVIFKTEVTLPEGFPDKYKKAILASVNNCTVKKTISAGPLFESHII